MKLQVANPEKIIAIGGKWLQMRLLIYKVYFLTATRLGNASHKFWIKKKLVHVHALNGHVNPSPSCVYTRSGHVNMRPATSRRPHPRTSPVEHHPRLCHRGLLPTADPPMLRWLLPAAIIVVIYAPMTATTRTSPTASTTPTRAPLVDTAAPPVWWLPPSPM